MSTAVLHIGTEKTGSTSIQKFLASNADALSAAGFLYPESCGRLSNHQLALYALIDSDPVVLEAMLPIAGVHAGSDWVNRFERKYAAEMERFRQSQANGVTLYSSEHLHSRLHKREELQRLKALLEQHHDTIQIVVYLRRQDKLALSAYNSQLRNGHEHQFKFPVCHGKPYYYDFKSLVERWSNVFGENHVEVRLFEKQRLHLSDVVADFTANLGIDATADGYIRPEPENEALSQNAQALLLGFNRCFLSVATDSLKQRDELRRKFVRSLSMLEDDSPAFKPQRAEAEKFYDRFKKDNDEIAQKWLDGRSFDESFDDYPSDADQSDRYVDHSACLFEFFRDQLFDGNV